MAGATLFAEFVNKINEGAAHFERWRKESEMLKNFNNFGNVMQFNEFMHQFG